MQAKKLGVRVHGLFQVRPGHHHQQQQQQQQQQQHLKYNKKKQNVNTNFDKKKLASSKKLVKCICVQTQNS